MTANELELWKHACRVKVEEAISIAESEFNQPIPPVKVEFSNRMTKVAGSYKFQAFYNHHLKKYEVDPVKIQLSLPYLEKYKQEFVDETPGHEAAHYIVSQVYGYGKRIKPHGHQWKWVMSLIGQSPDRCHNMNLNGEGDKIRSVSKARKTVPVTCGCPGKVLQLGAIRAKRMMAGSGYMCKVCKHSLKFK